MPNVWADASTYSEPKKTEAFTIPGVGKLVSMDLRNYDGIARYFDEDPYSPLLNEAISRLLPSLHAITENLRVLISHFNVFGCLTGRGSLCVSTAIKDDLMVLG